MFIPYPRILRWLPPFVCVLATLSTSEARTANGPARPPLADEVYKDYQPGFKGTPKNHLMKLSVQPTFFNRATIVRDQRADALLKKGIELEGEKNYRDAGKLYQQILEKYPDSLLKVSAYGVFVTFNHYIQQRLLSFPKDALAHYRMLYEAPAKELYERARKRNSLEGLHDVTSLYLATFSGTRAVNDLASHALDLGYYEKAIEYYEQLLIWHPQQDLKGMEIAQRLAYALSKLGQPNRVQELRERLKRYGRLVDLKVKGIVKGGSKAVPYAPGQGIHQRRSPVYQSFGDYELREPMAEPLSSKQSNWMIRLPGAPRPYADGQESHGELLPFHRPWIVGNSFLFKHYNRIYCYSLVTGVKRWSFDLGANNRSVGRIMSSNRGTETMSLLYTQKDILVDEGLVFANVQVYGRGSSLVALDRVMGTLRWGAGPFKPQAEADLRTQYDAAPGLGHKAVYAPWIYNEGEGVDHLFTTSGLTAFDKHSGQVRWSKELARLAPSVSTQSRTGIRIFSSTPLVHKGDIYHVTNAGVVARIDEATGRVRWLMRYPHYWQNAGGDAHDEVPFGSGGSTPFRSRTGPNLVNRMPLISGERLFVSPVDSDQFFCLDRKTGKVLWQIVPDGRFAGMSKGGRLIFGGRELSIHDAHTGRRIWSLAPSYLSTYASPGQFKRMSILDQPTLTKDGHVYFSCIGIEESRTAWRRARIESWFYGEWCVDLDKRKGKQYRIFHKPEFKNMVEGTLRGRIRDGKNFKSLYHLSPPMPVNSDGAYDPAKRLPFRLHGVAAELVTTGDRIWIRYDQEALWKAVQDGKDGKAAKDPRVLISRAELQVLRGEQEAAIATLEQCRRVIKPEEQDLLREVDKELFLLYRKQAFKALLADDAEAFHKRCLQMSETSLTVNDEIRSLLALAESFERQKSPDRAIKCLQSIILHYGDVPFEVPLSAFGDNVAQLASIGENLSDVFKKKPVGFDKEVAWVEAMSKRMLPAYFSSVSDLAPDMRLEAERVAVIKLKALFARHPNLQSDVNQTAAEALQAGSLKVKGQRLKAFPGTAASQKVLNLELESLKALKPASRQRALWRLSDKARRFGLQLPAAFKDSVKLSQPALRPVVLPAKYQDRTRPYEDGGTTTRLLLKIQELQAEHAHLLFVGGRSKRRLDNKFSLECWDMKAWKKKWEIKNKRLEGKGEEPGFSEVFVTQKLALTHGLRDVLAFDLESGTQSWHFLVPFNFDLRAANLAGDLLILSGANNTLALQVDSGEVAWQKKDMGELYARPYVRDAMLVSVRREPFGVTFRNLGSGSMERTLQMPDLSLDQTHPVLASEVSHGVLGSGVATGRLSVACKGDLLVLTDQQYYFGVDLKKMSLRWKILMPNPENGSNPIRFFLHEPYLVVLKRDFTLPTLYLYDTRTGRQKWMLKTTDVVYSIKFGKDGKSFYGIRLTKGGNNEVELKRYDTESGKANFTWTWKGSGKAPDAEIVGSFEGPQVAMRVIEGQRMEWIVVDTAAGKPVHRFGMKGVGIYGTYGGISIERQGSNLVLMNPEQILCGVPAE